VIRDDRTCNYCRIEAGKYENSCNSNGNYDFLSSFCLRWLEYHGILRQARPMRVSAFPRPPRFFHPELPVQQEIKLRDHLKLRLSLSYRSRAA
jgi:hypothetical protein